MHPTGAQQELPVLRHALESVPASVSERDRQAGTPREVSVPGVGDTRRLPAAIMLVEPTLCFGDAADAGGK